MKRLLGLLLLAFLIPGGSGVASAQATRPDTVVGPLKDGWESIDQRLVFLTVRLSSVEASIDGVNKALGVAGWQKNKKLSEAENAQGANDAMDQNGGGPVPWQQFYGNTAAQFFYHPTDDHTIHVNPLPIDQRPPQLDYIYRANANAQQRAQEQADDLGKKIDELLARRRHLQEQQSALWGRMSFRAIETRNISLKPLLRYDVTKSGSDPTDLQRVDSIRAGAKFVRTVDQLMGQAQTAIETQQGAAVDALAKAIDAAHKELMGKLEAQQLLATDLADSGTAIGKFAAAAGHLTDSSANIAEAYGLVRDGDKSGDDQEIRTFRGQLQQSYFDLAASLYTAEQCLTTAAEQWKVVPDNTRAAPEVSVDLGLKDDTKQDSPSDGGHSEIRGGEADSFAATLFFEADIDGSDTVSVTPQGLAWSHKTWGPASGVRVNGMPWDISERPFLPSSGALAFLGTVDLSSATVIGRSGRDTVSVERTDSGINVYFADAPNGSDHYTIRIGFRDK